MNESIDFNISSFSIFSYFLIFFLIIALKMTQNGHQSVLTTSHNRGKGLNVLREENYSILMKQTKPLSS